MDPDIARQLDIQKAELAKSFNECAIVLRRTAGVAEHLATVVNHVSFLSSPPEQKSQYLAVLDIANSLSALVPSPNATPAAPSNKRKAGALKEPKEKKEKAAKDPNAPKKPATAYLLYQNKVRANVKAENPEFTNKELMGKIGALWSALPDNEKQPYHDAVTKAREQYAKDVSEYEENKEGGAAAVSILFRALLTLLLFPHQKRRISKKSLRSWRRRKPHHRRRLFQRNRRLLLRPSHLKRDPRRKAQTTMTKRRMKRKKMNLRNSKKRSKSWTQRPLANLSPLCCRAQRRRRRKSDGTRYLDEKSPASPALGREH
ncbi:hypothetical protein BS47DRAFT_292610 [Hydnum rufescens UP504]|uniref:HMG box domain-containing protein n=1 Tax=Hydnum rufescens UP504 TaxID=1448309 RepID=A0A9P6B648_9AGAM|nr:hypothetical protein BS47DRAFT_292610 [Hydnum rufescens UP504]